MYGDLYINVCFVYCLFKFVLMSFYKIFFVFLDKEFDFKKFYIIMGDFNLDFNKIKDLLVFF